MSFLRKIISSGIEHTELNSEKRNVVLSNYISIISALAALATIIGRLIFANITLIWFTEVLAASILFLLPLLMNALGYTTISRLLLCWVPSLVLMAIAILILKGGNEFETSTYVGIRFYFLTFICFPFLVFSLKNNGKWFLLGLLGPVLPLLFFDPVLNFFNVGYFQIGLHEETYSYNNVRAFISILVIGFSSYFLKRLIENSEQLNDSLINELVEKNARIAEQNEKLREQQEELRSINQNLEGLVSERTEKIKAKNKQITKYAFTNSHRVRGPLARILGLLALSKLNNQEDYKFLFEKIQKEAMDMDAITHEINTDLDDDVD
ncbi:MAG TPA: hypothetical protein VL443_04425 [Cyclobacteriaceae bacterium]|nr:hypothetical protein [Cyclobacteriaceae bacterium]